MVVLGDGNGFFGQTFATFSTGFPLPDNDWVRMVVDADVGFDVAQIIISNIEPGTETDLIPTPVEVGSVYLDNLFFSNGNLVPEPAFVTPDAIDITFSADDLVGMDITAFNSTATVTTSPNGDQALQLVKHDGSGPYDSGAIVWFPAGAGQYSLLTADHTEVVMNVYAPAADQILMKLESSVSGDSVETSVVTTGAGWQTVRLDFSDQIDTTVVYDKAVVFPSFGDAGTARPSSSMTLSSLIQCLRLLYRPRPW